jgi:hypothetical protein
MLHVLLMLSYQHTVDDINISLGKHVGDRGARWCIGAGDEPKRG